MSQSESGPKPSPPPRPPPPMFGSPSLIQSSRPLPAVPPGRPSPPNPQSNVNNPSPTLNLNHNNSTSNLITGSNSSNSTPVSSFFTPTPGRRSLTTSSFLNSTTRRIGSLGKGGIRAPSFLTSILGTNQSTTTGGNGNKNNPGGGQPSPGRTSIGTTNVVATLSDLNFSGRPRGNTESSNVARMTRGSVDNGCVMQEGNEVTRPGFQLSRPHELLNTPSQLVSAQCLSPRPRPRQFGLMQIPLPAATNNPITSPNKLSDRFCEANNKLNIDGQQYPVKQEDLQWIEELGTGASGQVVKYKHLATGKMIAVKIMRISKNDEESKRIAMDLETLLKCSSSDHIVKCYGYIIRDTEVWICMELMASCFEKLLKKLNKPFPEAIIGKVAVSTLKALNYLKDSHKVMHRDIKPSNILVNESGLIKLCDFGISGNLIDSKAKTRQAGCTAYLAPERIDSSQPYDVRADVWSFGITLVELAKGKFPYEGCECDFEVLTKIVREPAPSLDPDKDGFSPEFCDFTKQCLIKDSRKRPKYKKLLDHPFIQRYEETDVDVASWFQSVNSSPH